MQRPIKHQLGVTLSGLLFVSFILIMCAILGMKITPEVQEYFAIMNLVKATAQDPALKNATIPEIRNAYGKRSYIESIKSISQADIDITKEGGVIVLSFAYPKKIPLFANVSLVIDFKGSSADASK